MPARFLRALVALSIVSLLMLAGSAVASAEDGTREASAQLTGAAEVPGPGDPDGSGGSTITFKFDAGEVCWSIDVEGITLPAAAAHIHDGAAGVAGGVIVTLSPPDASGHSEGCAATDHATQDAIWNDLAGHYVNVHTSDYPDGALRGQLVAIPDTAIDSGSGTTDRQPVVWLLLAAAAILGAIVGIRRSATGRRT